MVWFLTNVINADIPTCKKSFQGGIPPEKNETIYMHAFM